MAFRDFRRGRLALRIYLVGLAQLAVIAAGFVALLEMNRRDGKGPHEGEIRFLDRTVELALADPHLLRHVLDSARDDLHATVTVFDPNGEVVITNASAGVPACNPMVPGKLPKLGEKLCIAKPLRFPDGRIGHIEQHKGPPGPPGPPATGWRVIALILVVVGISSWLLARTLTTPLRRLSMAARAFGGGDLKARAALQNRDELGEVSRAFDEMAERVTNLLRAERELLANVSHELRTPLSRIRMALALVSEAEGDVAVAQEMLGEVTADLDELERLISDVLTAARLDFEEVGASNGIPPLRRERVDLHELLTFAASRFRTAHPNRTLHVAVPEDLPAVDADPVLLRRVFDNLLENAHKYTERQTEAIELIAQGGDEITVDVIDKGIGIDATDLPRVFRPFYRVDKSRRRATGGLGLGLPLAKRIVDAHGGKLELVSTPKRGTRAQVRLPITPVVTR